MNPKSNIDNRVRHYMRKSDEVSLCADTVTGALMKACEDNEPEVVKALIERGADVNAPNYYKRTAFEIAMEVDSEDCMRAILESGKVDLEYRNVYGRSLLHIACEKGKAKAVKLLASHGFDVNELSRDTLSPLMAAMSDAHVDCVRTLLDHGADPNLVSGSGNGVLHRAVLMKRAEIVDLLLERGADIELRNHAGMTPLQVACKSCHVPMMTRLLEAGADPNANVFERQSDGRTIYGAFELFANHKSVIPGTQDAVLRSVALTFLSYGAKPTWSMTKDVVNLNPLQAAAVGGLSKRAIEILEEEGVEAASKSNAIDLARGADHEDTAAAISSAISRMKVQAIIGSSPRQKVLAP